MSKRLLEVNGLSVNVEDKEILHGINLEIKKGETHVLMGPNGAGKSTLMKVLAGVHKCDDGEIWLKGKKTEIQSPRHAQELGIAMIHQELSPVPEMTVAENIFLGREPRKGLFVDYKKMYTDTEKLLGEMKVRVSPRAKIGRLKVADQQLIEISKAISLNADIIVMDEPTSAITDQEVEILFKTIADLKKKGTGIIYISHKMDEMFRIADDITVLRDGTYVNSWEAKDIDNNTLIKNMVGRELNEIFPKIKVPAKNVVMEIRHFTKENQFEDISFLVREGEILGIAGLIGAGRTELMNAIFGLEKPDSGEVFFEGKKVEIRRPSDAIRHGIAYVTEDRKNEGLVLEMGVGQNITIASMKTLSSGIFIKRQEEKKTIDDQIRALRIKVHSPRQLVGKLSGGNQQKVVLAKWMMKNPKLLILDEPTRGIDIGAKSEIYKLMGEFVEKGNSIIMISSEMPEAMGMSDRILVLSNGRLSGELSREEFVQEDIMKMAVSYI